MAIEKSVEMVLKIKPVYVHLIHRTPYMGPCRYGEGEQLERAYDEMMAADRKALCAVDAALLKEQAAELGAAMANCVRVVFGSKDAVEAAKELFDTVETL